MPRLRVRSTNGSTTRLEVPRGCTLGDLKELIRLQLGLDTVAGALKLSLNGRAELSGRNEEPIAMVGICSGDLVHLMEAQCAGAKPMPGLSCDSQQSRHTSASLDSPSTLSCDLLDRPASLRVAATAPFQQESSAPAAQYGAGPSSQQNGAGPSSQQLQAATAVPVGEPTFSSFQQNGAGPSSQQLEAATAVPVGEPSLQPGQWMKSTTELDDEVMQQEVSPSFPASLKSCLRAAGDLQSAAQLLLLTVHSALLEAGLHLVQGEPNCAKPQVLTLHYCLASHCHTAKPAQCTVKANLLGGTHLAVAGMATASKVHHLVLTLRQVVNADKLWWPEAMFRDWPGLWQQLKAELAIPLQAGLCHAEGVALPGSLLMLPTEVKQCCFQNLEARDLAMLCEVCRELRDVCSSNLLWRSKFEAAFGNPTSIEAEEGQRLGWQAVYGTKWICRARQIRRAQRRQREIYGGVPFPGARGPHIPLPQPGMPINGGDFDRLPAPFLGMPGMTGGPLGMGGIGAGFGGAGFRLPGSGFGQPPGSCPFHRSRDAARWRLH